MKQINLDVLNAIAAAPADERIPGLVTLIKSNYDPEEGTSILFDAQGNLYIGCVSRVTESEFNNYFCKRLTPEEQKAIEDILPKNRANMIDSDGCLKIMPYAKKFDDGFVQFLEQGEFWQSKPGYAWALYGHVHSM